MPFDDETTDVLIGGYLSTDAAHEDYEAVLNCGGDLHGAVVVSKDLEGNLSVEQTDHTVEEGAAGLAAVGFVVGLFAPPLLAATAIGAALGAVGGQGVAQEDRQQDRGDGRRDDPDRWRRPDRRLSALGGREGRARGDPCDPEGGRRGRGPPREGPQGRARRRAAEDGRRKRVGGASMTSRESDDRGAVIVTGTSTGIGVACVRHLAGKRFSVLAGVRSETDAEALRDEGSSGLTPLMIDITSVETIAAGRDGGRRGGRRTWSRRNSSTMLASGDAHCARFGEPLVCQCISLQPGTVNLIQLTVLGRAGGRRGDRIEPLAVPPVRVLGEPWVTMQRAYTSPASSPRMSDQVVAGERGRRYESWRGCKQRERPSVDRLNLGVTQLRLGHCSAQCRHRRFRAVDVHADPCRHLILPARSG